jgi:hypothetical protein
VSLCKAQTFRFQTTETLQGRDVRHISRSTRLATKPGNSTTSCPRTDSVSELAYRCYFLNTSRGLVMSPIPMTTNSHPAAPYSLSVFCMAVLSGGTSTTL